MIGYTLHVATTYDDGHTGEWTYDRAGEESAAEAFDALRKRWRAAGFVHTADRHTLTLVREITNRPEIGPYTDTIRYLPWDQQPGMEE